MKIYFKYFDCYHRTEMTAGLSMKLNMNNVSH